MKNHPIAILATVNAVGMEKPSELTERIRKVLAELNIEVERVDSRILSPSPFSPLPPDAI